MPERRTVMISSTNCDLPLHRDEVRDGCERAGFEPRHRMEILGSRAANPVQVSLKMVEEADIYIGIFAYRYGHIPKGEKVSITEMEYDLAV